MTNPTERAKAALTALLDIHVDDGICELCESAWPCETAELAQEALRLVLLDEPTDATESSAPVPAAVDPPNARTSPHGPSGGLEPTPQEDT